MWLILYFILWLLNIICVLVTRKSKILGLLSYIYMGVLFVSNSGTTGDAYKYKIDFEARVFDESWTEFGYGLFKNILRNAGIQSYNGLLIVLFAFTSIFLILGIRRFNRSYNTVLAVAMPFIFPSCAVAIRFFVAMGVMVFSIRFLVNRQPVPYILCVLFSSSFHRTALLYLIFLICMSNRIDVADSVKKIGIKLVVVFSIISVVLTYVLGKVPFINLIISFVSSFFSDVSIKLDAYTSSITRFGALMFFVIYIFGLLFAILLKKSIQNKNLFYAQTNSAIIEFSKVNYYIQLLLSVMLPFIVINLVYYRLLMFGFLSNAILYGMYISQHSSSKHPIAIKINSITVLFIAICVLWLVPEVIGINSITIQGIIDASVLLK